MGSSPYSPVRSFTVEIPNPLRLTSDATKCEHNFSIRGYVSEMRKKDWKACWPFPVDDSEERPSLPPLDVQKSRYWGCRNCERKIVVEAIHKDKRTDANGCSSGCKSDSNSNNAAFQSDDVQQSLVPKTHDRSMDIDLNKSADMSCDSNGLPSRITDHEIGLEDDLNHQASGVQSEKAVQEVHADERGCEGNGVSNVDELAISNLKCADKSSAEICNEGTPTPADHQCQKELRNACTILGEDAIVTEAGNIIDHATEDLPLESVACNHAMPVGSRGLLDSDSEDDREHKRTRLLSDLFGKTKKSKTQNITIQESGSHGPSIAPAASQTLSIKGKRRKRKPIPDDKEWIPADMRLKRVEKEVTDLMEDAETTDTVLYSRSKDVRAGVGSKDAKKTCKSKPEIERSHSMSTRKNKKFQVVDDNVTSEPLQGQKSENEDAIDVANEPISSKSKTLTSGFSPHAPREEGMDNLPLCAPRTTNECNFSKGKEKMLQADEELDPLYCENELDEDEPDEDELDEDEPEAQDEEELQLALQLSLGCSLAAQLYNEESSLQIENQPPFPYPFQEGTSKTHDLKRKGKEIIFFEEPSIPSEHITDSISRKGICIEEPIDARNTQKTPEAVEQEGIMKTFIDLTADEEYEQGTEDDIPMDIVEHLAQKQYERSLPDVEIIDGTAVYGKGELSLLKEGQKENSQGRNGENGMVTEAENIKSSKTNLVHNSSLIDGNHLGLNNLCSPDFPPGFEVPQFRKKPSSSGFHYSPMDSIQLGSTRNSNLHGSIGEHGSSSNANLKAQAGCSYHKTTLQQDVVPSRFWGNLTTNQVSLGYGLPSKMVVSQPRSNNMDMTKLRSSLLHKQNMNRNLDLGTFSGMNAENPVLSKHYGMESDRDLNESLDLCSDVTISAINILTIKEACRKLSPPFNLGVNAEMLKRLPSPDDCNTNLELGLPGSHGSLNGQSSNCNRKSYLPDKPHDSFLGTLTLGANSPSPTDLNDRNSTGSGKGEMMEDPTLAMQNGTRKELTCLETETPPQCELEVHGAQETSAPLQITSERSCTVNRNPADFTMPEETGNAYMIKGEELKFEESVPENRLALPAPRRYQRKRSSRGGRQKQRGRGRR